MIRNKTIKFNMDKEEDRILWKWLQEQPHGNFSEVTKIFWRTSMNKESQIHKALHDAFWEEVKKKMEKSNEKGEWE